jgi:hypothetical protein
VNVDDLEIPAGKLNETAKRVIDRAVDEVHRRDHLVFATPHALRVSGRGLTLRRLAILLVNVPG